jgi:hypothetical protein
MLISCSLPDFAVWWLTIHVEAASDWYCGMKGLLCQPKRFSDT